MNGGFKAEAALYTSQTKSIWFFHSSQSLLGDHTMKNSLFLLLAWLAVIIWFCPSGQAVDLVSSRDSQLIKTVKKEQPSRQLHWDLKKTVLKFYQLDLNSKFWTRYETLTHHCLKINFFWSPIQRTVNQIIIACLQPLQPKPLYWKLLPLQPTFSQEKKTCLSQ